MSGYVEGPPCNRCWVEPATEDVYIRVGPHDRYGLCDQCAAALERWMFA